jgi:hypothetical protein
VKTGACIVIVGLVIGVGGCQDAKQDAEAKAQLVDEAAGKLRADEAKQLADAKAQLVADPSAYLEASDIGYYDKGIINDYRQVTRMRVMNRSKFPVTSVSGDIDWMDDGGAKVGSMPFSVSGSIAAGDTKLFSTDDGSLTNGTLQASAKRVIVRFTHVTIVEAP